jgi:hypothetical protein
MLSIFTSQTLSFFASGHSIAYFCAKEKPAEKTAFPHNAGIFQAFLTVGVSYGNVSKPV